MSIVATKWSSKSRSVNDDWTTIVTVQETFENPDGSTDIKTREIEMEGNPDKEAINVRVESTQELQEPSLINQSPEEFIREAVAEHNALRQRHGVPPLSIAQDLCDVAQKWANYLIDNNKRGHSSNGFGENLAEKTGNSPNLDYAGKAATNSWYSEIKNYQQFFGTEPPSFEEMGGKMYGHFTQVVWKGSQEIGIGKAKKNGRVVIVANYRPAGNLIGTFAKNVFPPNQSVLPGSVESTTNGTQPSSVESTNNGTQPGSVESTTNGNLPGSVESTTNGTSNSTKNDTSNESDSSDAHSVNMSVKSKSTKVRTNTQKVNGNTSTTVNVEETFTYSDGSTQVKTRELVFDGPPPSKEQIQAFVNSSEVDGDAFKKLSLSSKSTESNETLPTNSHQKPPPNTISTHEQPPGYYAEQALNAHNGLRAKHGVPALTCAADLCAMAQKWADHLFTNNLTEHSPNDHRPGTGENIAYLMGTMADLDYPAEDATESWYSEIKNYGPFYGKEPPPFGQVSAYGHFTQIVWKDTKEMGIGKAKGNGRVVVVANYRPAGNFIGSYSQNVFPPR
ncbi:uncharacterized protein LOC127723083 [Mytilus californianus]|uniref:uncharacterized protein LOC127723083 n=1 Tax=Mytilus californianus TaxID=6549 RepID=UPI002245BEA7|nr:uncharacterized protein LOC127723083 [Mytilus californianus]